MFTVNHSLQALEYMENRREFIKKSALAGLGMSFTAGSYARILGSNDRVRVGIVGFSDRFRQSLAPAFAEHAKGSTLR